MPALSDLPLPVDRLAILVRRRDSGNGCWAYTSSKWPHARQSAGRSLPGDVRRGHLPQVTPLLGRPAWQERRLLPGRLGGAAAGHRLHPRVHALRRRRAIDLWLLAAHVRQGLVVASRRPPRQDRRRRHGPGTLAGGGTGGPGNGAWTAWPALASALGSDAYASSPLQPQCP